MKASITLLLLTLLINYTHAQTLDIQLKNGDAREEQTKQQVLKLISTYDLKKWIFTDKIIIESGFNVIPHSHPVLTLSIRHLKDDDLLLATFVHEQLHWFIDTHAAKKEVYEQLKVLYPNPMVQFPDGSGNETGTYYHILVCHLEYRALKQLLGELKAFQVITFWQQDHYKWIYKTVLQDQRQLDELVRKYGIVP